MNKRNLPKNVLRVSLFSAVLLTDTIFSAAGQILRKPVPDKLVVLTFDDAVSTHATFVAPLLKQYGFGGTFFVCEFPPDFEDKTKYMSWEQIDTLGAMGFEIANHTRYHTHVPQMTPPQLEEELDYIEQTCQALGEPRPVSFAYPAYDTASYAVEILQKRAYQFARIGGDKAYDPTQHHPYFIPSYSTTGTDKDRVIEALQQAKDGRIVVLTLHGVPDYAHDWVTTPPELFEEYLLYLQKNEYQVVALRDLAEYIDVAQARQQIAPPFK